MKHSVTKAANCRCSSPTRGFPFAVMLCLTVGLIALPGCTTSEPGVSSTAVNSQQMTTPRPVPEVARAAVRAFEKLDLHDIQRRDNRKQGLIRGYTASNTPVRLYIRQTSQDKSGIQIRVGTLGDKDLGVTVLRKVKAELGLPANSVDQVDQNQ